MEHINTGYVLGQLDRALKTAGGHQDAATRERAARRVERWTAVLEGLHDGSLSIGSRMPVRGAPAWATLEVVTGGFATGALLAGGPLLPHELARRERLALTDAGRRALNLSYLTDEGRAELAERRAQGTYRVTVPEEGALLVLGWLLDRGEVASAEVLLEALLPHFDQLRFYPVPHDVPLGEAQLVRLESVAQVISRLESIAPQQRIAQMNEALTVWAPLTDRAVSLFLETVAGETPTLVDGKARGGWPLEQLPATWRARAKALLADLRAVERRPLARTHLRAKENLARLRHALELASQDPALLDARGRGLLRGVLAACVTARGVPGSERHRELRERQRRVAALPSHASLARVVVERLRAVPGDAGLSSVDAVAAPVSAAESATLATQPNPPSVQRRVLRCLEAPVDELVERGLIRSGEVLAQVLPQLTAQLRAANLADAELRRVYAATYAAFRRRRSLLLVDLAHQVRLEELPWVAALDAQRTKTLGARVAARQALERLVVLDLVSFPQTLLPNKLVTEFQSLGVEARLSLALTEELAADIFMGTFTNKFAVAAKAAARLLTGTLYARYYALPVAQLDALALVKGQPAAGFAALCAERAGPGKGSVAQNGRVIEQAQVLTTHNLATLFDQLALAQAVPVEALARRCFTWVVQALARPPKGWQPQLRKVKDAAYAWRHLVFFLSFVDEPTQRAFVGWARGELGKVPRLAPAVRGLAHVVDGGAFAADGTGPDGARRFLGWSTERHWLMPAPP